MTAQSTTAAGTAGSHARGDAGRPIGRGARMGQPAGDPKRPLIHGVAQSHLCFAASVWRLPCARASHRRLRRARPRRLRQASGSGVLYRRQALGRRGAGGHRCQGAAQARAGGLVARRPHRRAIPAPPRRSTPERREFRGFARDPRQALLRSGQLGAAAGRLRDLNGHIAMARLFLRGCYHKQPADADFATQLAYNMLAPLEVRIISPTAALQSAKRTGPISIRRRRRQTWIGMNRMMIRNLYGRSSASAMSLMSVACDLLRRNRVRVTRDMVRRHCHILWCLGRIIVAILLEILRWSLRAVHRGDVRRWYRPCARDRGVRC